MFVFEIIISHCCIIRKMNATKITDAEAWDKLIIEKDGHPLQLWGWGEVKSSHGWTTTRLRIDDGAGDCIGGAQVLERSIPLIGRTIAYIPRGPWCSESSRRTVLKQIVDYMRANSRAISILIEPDWMTNDGLDGWQRTDQRVLLARTLQLDLTRSLEDLLTDIASKRRYDIRTSTKKLTEIRPIQSEEELSAILAINHETASRANFALHTDEYYRDLHDKLGDRSVIIAAFDKAQPVAFSWYAVTPHVAFELYGGIIEAGQKLRANYGLKWYGIEYFQSRGVNSYDFNGLLNDGISSFKRSFATHETQLVGSYIKPLSGWHYLWNRAQPLAKHVARFVAKLR